MNKLLRPLAVGVLVAVTALSLGAQAEILEQVLVKVNADIITKTQLESWQVAALRQNNQQLNDEQLKREIARITPEILVQAVDDLLVQQRGRELGIKLGDEQFNKVLASIKKENKLEDEAQFQAALKQEGLTMAELRKNLERSMVRQQVEQAEIFNRIQITEPEERAYYELHKNELATPAAVTLREILVSVASDGKALNVGLDEEAKAKAEAARQRAVGGESFEKLVAEVSDAPSKANAGLVGPVNLSELAKDVATVLAPLKAGEVSPVFRTSRGYQVIKIETKSETVVPPFEQARQRIADQLFNQKRQAEFNRYIERLRASAIIEWKNPELQKLYEQHVKTRKTLQQ
jgi:peptidyl-prolyl cis-trans isomerase SurA